MGGEDCWRDWFSRFHSKEWKCDIWDREWPKQWENLVEIHTKNVSSGLKKVERWTFFWKIGIFLNFSYYEEVIFYVLSIFSNFPSKKTGFWLIQTPNLILAVSTPPEFFYRTCLYFTCLVYQKARFHCLCTWLNWQSYWIKVNKLDSDFSRWRTF